jgi:hypothetical protein
MTMVPMRLRAMAASRSASAAYAAEPPSTKKEIASVPILIAALI